MPVAARRRPRHGDVDRAGAFEKRLHVSPLMGMEHVYDWRLTEPGERLAVHIESADADGETPSSTRRSRCAAAS